MKELEQMVDRVLQDEYLTPETESQLKRLLSHKQELSIEDYMALDRMMEELLAVKGKTLTRKQYVNIMEELVMEQAIAHVLEHYHHHKTFIDVGEVTAYALNRLPTLYATSQEGRNFQRRQAQGELQDQIQEQVAEAFNQCKIRANYHPDRQILDLK